MNECENCQYYNKEGDYCTAFICSPIDCDTKLPCDDTDVLEVREMRGVGECEEFLQGYW